MQIVTVKQNTDAWHLMRKEVIGGSDIAAIMKVSAWQTPYELWCDKKGYSVRDENKEFIFEKGHRLEVKAIAKLSFHLGIMLSPAVIKHQDISYCQVSLDGFNLEHRTQVEVKFMGAEDWLALKEHGTVPTHYMPQVLYQLIATGFGFSFFCGINEKEEIAYTRIYPTEEKVVEIIKAADAFYHNHMVANKPPELTDQDTPTLESPELLKAAQSHLQASEAIRCYEAQLFELEQFIFGKMTTHKATVGGLKLTRTVNKAGTKVVKVKQ